EEFSSDRLDQALERGARAFDEWRHVSFAERSTLMHSAAGRLRERKARLAGLITTEMGKPIVEAEAEIEKCSWNCDFYADNAEQFLAPKSTLSNAAESYVAFEPLGQVLAIMPRKFTFWMVLADADVTAAAKTVVRARNQNAGNSCNAAKRFIVVESVADEFEQRFNDGVAHLKIGDPMQRETQIGPLARGDLRDSLEEQVRRSVDEGAHVALGGHRREGRGYFYAPTVLTRATPVMTAAREETFGPVAAVMRARDTDEAVTIANQTPFGLGASLWTRDIDWARSLAR